MPTDALVSSQNSVSPDASVATQEVTVVPGSILGNLVRRVEDPELLVGRARYVDDIPAAGALHAAFARSPFAHARIGDIDVSAAEQMPGVVAVLTAERTMPSELLPPFGPPMSVSQSIRRWISPRNQQTRYSLKRVSWSSRRGSSREERFSQIF